MNYMTGDVLLYLQGQPPPWALLHVVNDRGGWGKGITGQITRRFGTFYERVYRDWADCNPLERPFRLGEVCYARYEGRTIAHMLAQSGYSKPGKPACDLVALNECLDQAAAVVPKDMPVHMPRIGCGLGGRKWAEVEPLIRKHFWKHQRVTIWSLKE